MKTCRGEEKSTALPSGVKPRTMSGPGCQVSRVGVPPVDGDGVDVGVAVVLGAEGDGLAVGREDGLRLDADVAGQPADVLAVEVGDPEIVGVDEGDVLGADGRLGQKPRVVDVGLGLCQAGRGAARRVAPTPGEAVCRS